MSACVLCDRTDAATVVSRGPFSVVRCLGCGLARGTPQPDENRIHAQYEEDLTSPTEYYTRTEAVDLQVFGQRLAIIERFRKPGRLVDVGCSVGTWLKAARSRGWQASGVEANPRACGYCRSQGFEVVQGFFDTELGPKLSSVPDVIHMGDVIEHFKNPLDAVRIVHDLLPDGGVFSIVTPDFDSWIVRKFQVKPLEHLFYFTGPSLSRLLEAAGFRILHLQKTTRRRDIDSVLYGTTFHGPISRPLLTLVTKLGLGRALATVLEWVVRDELLVIAEKQPTRSA